MRTTHVQINKHLTLQTPAISEEVFFTSQPFRDYLADIAEAASKRYQCPVKIILRFEPQRNYIAYTNNRHITINTANELTAQFALLYEKADSLVGFLAHELGHILYTDFDRSQAYFKSLDQGKLTPALTKLTAQEKKAKLALQQYVLDGNYLAMKLVQTVAHRLLNILEDAYVEEKMIRHFPGRFAYAINRNRQEDYRLTLSFQEQLDKDLSNLSIMQNLLLVYSLYGQAKNPENISGALWEHFLKLAPIIDDIKDNGTINDMKVRLKTTSWLLLQLWPYIQETLEQLDKKQDDTKQDAAEQNATENTTKPAFDSATNTANTEEAANTVQSPAGLTSSKQDISSLIDTCLNGLERLSQEPIGQGHGIKEPKTQALANPSNSPTNDIEQDNSLCNTNTPGEPFSDKLSKNSIQDIDNLLTAIKLEKMNEDALQQYQKMARQLDYGSLHQNVQVDVRRVIHVPRNVITDYQQIEPVINSLARQMARQITAALPKDRGGSKPSYMGKRLVPRALIHNDGKYFTKQTLPQEPAKLSIALVVDESGSMTAYGRIDAARLTSMVLWKCCQILGIPILILGHTASSVRMQADLFIYSDFDLYDAQDKYRLMTMEARDHNRDGVAIRYAAERLLMRPEKKLLIILNDGLPNAYYYSGEDITNLVADYTRQGITIFAGAIGDDKQTIESFYKDGYLDLSELDKLPANMAKLIRQQLK